MFQLSIRTVSLVAGTLLIGFICGCTSTLGAQDATLRAEDEPGGEATEEVVVEAAEQAPSEEKAVEEKGIKMADEDLPEQFQDLPVNEDGKVELSPEEWKQRLTPNQFYVCREHGTEPSFRNEYWDNKEAGVYRCAACGLKLFSSETKYKSGTGWPSFWQPIVPEAVATQEDRKFFMVRTEVHCSRCEAHLGHVFEDGPKPTGLRYCMNSAAMLFEKGAGDAVQKIEAQLEDAPEAKASNE